MEFTAETIILKVGRFRDNDLWVKCFAPEQGMFTAFAFGGLRSRRRFMGCLDALNRVRFRVSTGRGQYLNLQEGMLLGSFADLRRNPERLGVAVNCIKFFEAVHSGFSHNREAYDMLVQTLEAIGICAHPNAFPALFRARICFAQGFSPELTVCSCCGSDHASFESGLFSPSGGTMLCPVCAGRHAAPADLPLSRASLELLGQVRSQTPAQWDTPDTPSAVLQECARAVDAFVSRHIGLVWDNGRFNRC